MKSEDKTFLELVNKFKSEKGEQLTEKDLVIVDRWKFAHSKMVDEFTHGEKLEQAIMKKYEVSRRTARYDIANAKKMFITEDMIDKSFWRGMLLQWQLKGLKMAFDKKAIKEFNAAIRNLYLITGLHKKQKALSPNFFKKNVYNFHSDHKKAGIPSDITDAEIVDFIDEIHTDIGLTEDQKHKLLKDAGIQSTDK